MSLIRSGGMVAAQAKALSIPSYALESGTTMPKGPRDRILAVVIMLTYQKI